MEKRRTNRIKHRLTCEIIVDRQSHPAVVRDLAPTGLFVQTRQRPAPNSVVEVRFPAFSGLPAFTIEAGVARHRNVHPRLQTEIQSGIGLEILGRPQPYLALASRVVSPRSTLAAGSHETKEAGRDQAPRSFRVRLAAHGRSHPRTITVLASSFQAARARAITQAGAGWKVTEVEAI